MAEGKEREIGQGGLDLVVEEAQPKLRKPPLYQVVLLNDDYTPMEFVVDVLERIFSLDRMRATRVMLEVHTKGKGVCGVYTFETYEGDHGNRIPQRLEEKVLPFFSNSLSFEQRRESSRR